MKIFLSFLQSPLSYPIAAYSFWEYYIKNGIEEAGHKWIECNEVDWAKGITSLSEEELNHWKASTWQKTIDHLKANKPDLFLSYLYPEQIDEQAIAEVKKMGIFTVNFFCDNIRLFRKPPKEFRAFDLNWVPEYKATEMYKKANIPFANLPMPMWVEPKYRTVPVVENQAISFIGSKDIQRHLLFERLFQKYQHLQIDIYGQGWMKNEPKKIYVKNKMTDKIKNQVNFLAKSGIRSYLNKIKQNSLALEISSELALHLKGRPHFDDYIRLSRESMITLGINRYPSFDYPIDKPNTYSRLRDIEAPMLGACYLTEWTEGLNELYDTRTEVLTYRNIDELNEQCELLSKDKVLRSTLRKNGQKRSLSDHSIPSLLKKIIK